MTFGGIVCSRSIRSGLTGDCIGISALAGPDPKSPGAGVGFILVVHPVKSTGVNKSSRRRFLMGLTFLVIV
jgi:hypothetical protein